MSPPSAPKTPTLPRQLHALSVLSRSVRGVGDRTPRGCSAPRSPCCCEPSPAVSLLPRLLAALALLAFVCTRRRLLVLLNRFANSVKLARFALDVDKRSSVWLRCSGEAFAVSVPSPDPLVPAGCGAESMLLGSSPIPANCG